MANSTAPWKALFSAHLTQMGTPEFSLATVTAKGLPKTRTCVHRGFFASPLPENPHNKHKPNPHVYDSDCTVFTTDARMSKVYDIFASSKGKGTLEQSRSGSGGGGYVQACYWAKDAKTQWRVTGKAWIIAADDIEGENATTTPQNSGAITVRAEVEKYLQPAQGSSDDEKDKWSWKNEVEMNFANLSPLMRGSFKNPPPGTPKSNGAGEGEKLGQEAGELEAEPLARKNFRLVVITPEEVEMVDLSDPKNAKRIQWTLTEAGQSATEWKETELWP